MLDTDAKTPQRATTPGVVSDYLKTLRRVVMQSVVTDKAGIVIPFEAAVPRLGGELRTTHINGHKIIFVGNGGSAGICSHLAVDFSKNGSMRAVAMNDSSVLTCLANDYGYEHVFAKQIEWHARPGDALVAISSSGRSPNIINAVRSAGVSGCTIYTFSGFDSDNELRRLGDLNFYVADHAYGIVEISHLTILHMVLDIQMGWRAPADTNDC